jgi:hypothetical protein
MPSRLANSWSDRARDQIDERQTIRKLAPKTQEDYIRTIKSFAVFLGRSPDTASFEDVRRFQLHLPRAAPIRPRSITPCLRCGSFSGCHHRLSQGRAPLSSNQKCEKLWILPSGPPALLNCARDSVRHRYGDGSPPDNLGSGGGPFSEKMTGRLTFRTEPGSN